MSSSERKQRREIVDLHFVLQAWREELMSPDNKLKRNKIGKRVIGSDMGEFEDFSEIDGYRNDTAQSHIVADEADFDAANSVARGKMDRLQMTMDDCLRRYARLPLKMTTESSPMRT